MHRCFSKLFLDQFSACMKLRPAIVVAAFVSCISCSLPAWSTNPPASWSFRNDVQPVLAKAGCSSGACHGAAAGQGGFKLSLRGYDDEGDWRAITRNAFSRRVSLVDPARSLFLMKATAAVPHKGGERFK